MTATPHDSADGLPAPPPGCPAHIPGPRSQEGPTRLYGPEVEHDAPALYEKLRAEHGGVAPVLVQGDVPAWLVLGYRENLDVSRNPTRFSRDSRLWREAREGRVAIDNPLLPITMWQPLCAFLDGEEAKRLRVAVTESLNRMDRRGIRRYVTRYADQLIDSFAARGHADLQADFAGVLPMLVMTKLLGMSDSYGPQLLDAARDMVQGTETAIASNAFIVTALRELVAAKKELPGDDFASWLIAHGSALGDEELVEHLRLVLIAAYTTTGNLIANTLHMVLTDQRFRGNLAGGHMTLPDALEQVLWDAPPFTAVYGRWATGDTELAGHRIKEGDMLVLGLAAGNADPAIRPDPSVPVHGNRSHLAFSGGPHECPGQDIGRAIADTGVDALLARLPDLRLTVDGGELRWRTSLLSRELVSLPVEFTPMDPAAVGQAHAAGHPDPASDDALLPVPVTQGAAPVQSGPVPWWQGLLRWIRGV
ncbi:cytochrome P450 [Streptomyces polyrhachis]|uniref:Cytochrome P450 n=1 Tax=Streptomyces polyrhachis TaxID=1282885 RepID=A0ABW2GDI5_9ACTN